MQTISNLRPVKLKIKILLMMLFFASSCLKAQQTGFSGAWTRNTEKSDTGGLSLNSIPVEILVNQNAGQIEIRGISKSHSHDTTAYSEILKSDGTSTSSIIKSNLNKRSNIQRSSDQKGFTENATYADD
jgi:hypothetical protein